MEKFTFSIVGHSADLKVSPTQSKDTGIFLSPELVEFLGDLDTLSFTIYKEDCIRALTALIYSLPLYSNKGGKIIEHKEKFDEFSQLLSMVEGYFGNYTTASYGGFSPSMTTGNRQYLYGLTKSSGFNLRKFFLADYTDITVYKYEDGHFDLRFTTKPVARVSESLADESSDTEEQINDESIENQIIYFGAPGTGKSFRVDKIIEERGVPSESVKRVTFYPDYSYSEFVGGLRPEKDKDNIKYEFRGGPFAEALRESFKGDYYLLIEEINRGNPAAIFGDIFQLLDRDKAGKSRYTITNNELLDYLKKDSEVATILTGDKVYIPAGLHILCTMNTADQNVFVLDTAFKRRFRMEYVPIDFSVFDTDKDLKAYKEQTDVFDGETDLEVIMDETDLIGLPDELERNWPSFARVVNAKIDTINDNEGDQISEDKKLGPFFVTLEEINDRKKFADKVLYYLKQDVFKYCDNVLTDSYEILFDRFVNKKEDIFEILCFAR